MLIPPEYRLLAAVIGVIAIAAVSFSAGWTVQGWRMETEIAFLRESWATELATSVQNARAEEQRQRAGQVSIDEKTYKELTNGKAEADNLRACIRSGKCGVRVKAKCPAPVSTDPEASSVDSGAGAELDTEAGLVAADIREGIKRLETKLAACQAGWGTLP